MKKIVIYSILMLIGALFFATSCVGEAKPKRILTLGIRNESNTFSTLPTKESDFKVLRGAEVVNDNNDWVKSLVKEGVEIVPTLHAYAWPGGVVQKMVFDRYKSEILDSIRNNVGRLDAIYMEMHGALHVEGYDDAQATLISDIRQIVGNKLIIGGSFDLHGNLSEDFVKHINVLTAYRTAPHRDGAETRVRAVNMILDVLKNKLTPTIESVTIPILVPGEKSITEVEPLHSIYAQIPEVAGKEGLMDASIFAGYCWADLPRSAMRVFVVAKDEKYSKLAKEEAQRLAQQIWDKRDDMILDVPSGSIDQIINKAKEYKGKTVFISDSGDNTTAGAPGDNPQVLEALLRNKTQNALVAGLVDADALALCKDAGVGKSIELMLGGKVDYVFGKPLKIKAKIEYLADATTMQVGREAAVLDVEGVKLIIINSRRSFIEVKDFDEVKLKGNVYLKNFKYRKATLDITVKGTGNKVKSVKVNGADQKLPYEFAADSKGHFDLEIEMMDDKSVSGRINMVEPGPGKCWSPVEPLIKEEAGAKLVWNQIPGMKYKIHGATHDMEATYPYDLTGKPNGFYTVRAIDAKGIESDLSNPILHSSFIGKYEAEDAKFASKFDSQSAVGFSGRGYVHDFTDDVSNLEFTVNITEEGNYGFALVGSNGRGPHDVYCYIRSVFVDGKDAGTFILESSGFWNTWTTSNYLILKGLSAGKHTISIKLNPENKGFDNNMSFDKGNKNDAYIDYLRVIKL